PLMYQLAKHIADTHNPADQMRETVEASTNLNDHIIVNFRRPLLNDPQIWKAINLAIDRKGYIQAGRQGAAVIGGVMLPKPYGVWGLPEAEQMKLPGFGDPAKQKDEAKKLLAEAGFGPPKPLKIAVSTRAITPDV